MTFSALDSPLTGPLFTTPAMRALFSARAEIAAMIEVEAALARVEAAHGLVPEALADAIAAIETDDLDLDAIGEATREAGVPSIPILAAMRGLLPDGLADHLHRGATTQDLIDTALALRAQRAFALLEAECDAVLAALVALARSHARTPCVGRTYGQHATPITFGHVVALWASGIAEAAAELASAARGVCRVSLGGPAGTLPGLGAIGPAIADDLARRLGLAPAPIAWHVRRGAIARAGCALAILTGALAKMAGDVVLLGASETAEVAEPHAPGRGGSSAMPHKRNPVSSTAILANASAARGCVIPLLDAVVAAHQRPAGAWHAEWHALPPLFGLAAGALAHARTIAEGLVVDVARMRANLEAGGGLVFAEAAASALAPHLGAAEAKARVTAAADRARAERIGLRAALAASADGVPLDAAFDLAPHIDASAAFVARALADLETRRA